MNTHAFIMAAAAAMLVLAAESGSAARVSPDDPSAIRGPRPPRPPKPWANKKTKTDRDGDALPDTLEQSPVPFGGAGTVTLNPERKDVVIIIDYVGTNGLNTPTPASIALILGSLADAPVKGANGKAANRGIAATVIVPAQGYNAPSTTSIGTFAGGNYDWSDVDAIKTNCIDRMGIGAAPQMYHYCLSCHNYGGSGSSGISRNNIATYDAFRMGAADFILSLQSLQSQALYAGPTAGTVLHEFGHNLGLTHGGYDHVNYKPNYISIMNYHFQFFGVVYGIPSAAQYWYSTFYSRPINEAAIKEKKGVGGPAKDFGTQVNYPPVVVFPPSVAKKVDWNLNGIIDHGRYPLLLNFPYDNELTWLVTENNYKNLNFTGGGLVTGAGAPVAGAGGRAAAPAPPRFTPATHDTVCQEFTPELHSTLAADAAVQARGVRMNVARTPAATIYTLGE